MAVVKYGGLVQEIKGSVGGTTFRGSSRVKTVYNKVSGNTAFKNAIPNKVNKLSFFHGVWRSMSGAQRTVWNNNASNFFRKDKFGSDVPYTGIELFLSVNFARAQTNLNPVVSSNFLQDIPASTLDVINIDSNGLVNVTFKDFTIPYFVFYRMFNLENSASYVPFKRSKVGRTRYQLNMFGDTFFGRNVFPSVDWSNGNWIGYNLSYYNTSFIFAKEEKGKVQIGS